MKAYYDRRAPEPKPFGLFEVAREAHRRDAVEGALGFTPRRLLDELGGGEVLHAGRLFVTVRS